MCDRCEPRPFPIRVTGATTRPTSTCHCVGVAMGSYDNTVSMRTPFDLNHRTDHWVTIDTCIATEIGWLWHQGVVTLNSCCGHGKLPASVIVAEEHYDLMDALGYEWELAPSGRRAHQLTSPTDTGDNGLRGACILALSNHSHADTCASELSPNAGYDCTCWRKVLVDALAAHSAIGGDE